MAKSKDRPGVMTVTEDSVTLTLTVPRHWTVALLKEIGAEVSRDLSDLIENPKALGHLFRYGVGRFNRDGCTPDKYIDAKGDFKDEKAEGCREATIAERAAEATRLSDAKWKALLTDNLKARTGATADPLVQECRILTVKALVKRSVARKAIPKLDTLAAMEAACAAYEGLWGKVRMQAEKVVAIRQAEDL